MRATIVLLISALATTAAGDPVPDPDPGPLTRKAAGPLLHLDVPKLPPVSLRLEAARVANDVFGASWRYPEPGSMLAVEGGYWFIGVGDYRPRTARSAALHGGSIAATMLGEILLGTGSPLGGVGALVTGATLDAAAADVDRDAESRRPR
jgi:hypothetical protein